MNPSDFVAGYSLHTVQELFKSQTSNGEDTLEYVHESKLIFSSHYYRLIFFFHRLAL